MRFRALSILQLENLMHTIRISEEVLEASLRRRGSKHIFLDLDPRRTAHLVIDLQNGFMREGAPALVPNAAKIVPNVNRISNAIRAAGGQNVFLRFTCDERESRDWSVVDTYLTKERRDVFRRAFTRGSNDWQLSDALDRTHDDVVLDKTRYSAFIQDTCSLPELLKARGVDTVIITGTMSNCCCESTARDAMQMNYRVIFVEDANAALTDELHNATLNNMVSLFADVMSTDMVVERLALHEQHLK
jgi:ureidoacrylate peracid hydrolase